MAGVLFILLGMAGTAIGMALHYRAQFRAVEKARRELEFERDVYIAAHNGNAFPTDVESILREWRQ